MTKAEKLIEISYVVGTRSREFTEAISRTGREMLMDDFASFVDSLAEHFDRWQADKDASELQLLHDFINEVFSSLDRYLELYF